MARRPPACGRSYARRAARYAGRSTGVRSWAAPKRRAAWPRRGGPSSSPAQVISLGHRQLALENLAVRQQLAVYKRTATRPKLLRTERLFWVWLAGWRQPLLIVAPATVLRWQRRRFREHWTTRSGRPQVGRPPVNAEIVALVRRMAETNPLWGAPRIHGGLMKLGAVAASGWEDS